MHTKCRQYREIGAFLAGYRVRPGGVVAAYRNTDTVMRIERDTGFPEVDIELADLSLGVVNSCSGMVCCDGAPG